MPSAPKEIEAAVAAALDADDDTTPALVRLEPSEELLAAIREVLDGLRAFEERMTQIEADIAELKAKQNT
jgi:hypothetical protein